MYKRQAVGSVEHVFIKMAAYVYVVSSLLFALLKVCHVVRRWFAVYISVSYTHLDVYKRQIHDSSRTMKRNICGLAHYGDIFYGVGHWGSDTGRFYKSVDKGASWTLTYVDTSVIRNLVDVVFTSADTGFITGAYKNWSAVAKTTDGGATWRLSLIHI